MLQRNDIVSMNMTRNLGDIYFSWKINHLNPLNIKAKDSANYYFIMCYSFVVTGRNCGMNSVVVESE